MMTTVLPSSVVLHANVPNPFNPSTTIRFELPRESVGRLEVFDVLGQQVKTLVGETRSAGTHQVVWNGRDASGMRVGNGVYFYRLETGGYTQMRRMLLLK